jgi:hypothetical protein
MDWDDLLVMMTVGALAPYLTVAARDWISRSDKH